MASSWQVACRVALGLSLLGLSVTVATAQEPTPTIAVVDQYRRARARTMEAGATEADVTAASALLADSVLYEHPAAGARQITVPGVVVAEERVSFEARRDSGWSRAARTQVTVYEVRDGHISRMIEYWQPH